MLLLINTVAAQVARLLVLAYALPVVLGVVKATVTTFVMVVVVQVALVHVLVEHRVQRVLVAHIMAIQQVVMFAAERVRQCVRHVLETVMDLVVYPVLEAPRPPTILIVQVIVLVLVGAVVEVLVRAVVIQAVAEFV